MKLSNKEEKNIFKVMHFKKIKNMYILGFKLSYFKLVVIY